MDGFDISTERVSAAGTGVADIGGSLAREIATMHDLLGEIRAGWQSSLAAPRFAAAMTGYLDDAARLKDALLSHGAALTSASRSYDATESALADSIPAVAR